MIRPGAGAGHGGCDPQASGAASIGTRASIGASMAGASMAGASMAGASMAGASMAGASMAGASMAAGDPSLHAVTMARPHAIIHRMEGGVIARANHARRGVGGAAAGRPPRP
ncbi:MAG: pentapeptide repeat-containing protein [Myxococcales bacterium]|nr:pentapeptide repeat-containing protein [Myxococcales bacterium]